MITIKAIFNNQRLLFKSHYPLLMIFNRFIVHTMRILTLFFLSSYFMETDEILKTTISDYRIYLFSNLFLLSFVTATIINSSRQLINELYTGTLVNLIMCRSNIILVHIGVLLEQWSRTVLESYYLLFIISLLGVKIPNIISIKFIISLVLLSILCLFLSVFLSIMMLYFRETFVLQNTFIFILTLTSGTYFKLTFDNYVINLLSSNTPLSFVFRYFRDESISYLDCFVFTVMCVLLVTIVIILEKKVFFSNIDNYVE